MGSKGVSTRLTDDVRLQHDLGHTPAAAVGGDAEQGALAQVTGGGRGVADTPDFRTFALGVTQEFNGEGVTSVAARHRGVGSRRRRLRGLPGGRLVSVRVAAVADAGVACQIPRR